MSKRKWFGIVRWCDEDISGKLRELGIDDTPENISAVRVRCEENNHFTDGMVEAGWFAIEDAIHEAFSNEMDSEV